MFPLDLGAHFLMYAAVYFVMQLNFTPYFLGFSDLSFNNFTMLQSGLFDNSPQLQVLYVPLKPFDCISLTGVKSFFLFPIQILSSKGIVVCLK